VAAAANGGVATASSTFSAAYPASAVNNGDRRGTGYGNGGVWVDATSGAYPDTMEIAFNGAKTISEVGVFTVQDNFQNPAEPTESLTFAQYGVADFDVQYWDGGAWATVPGGTVTGSNRVWSKFTFFPVETTKIRISVRRGLFGFSQIAEVEAWTIVGDPPPPPPPAPVNVASAANGAVASASSSFSSAYPASAANNGDRRGTGYGNGGVWADGSPGAYPDSLEIAFDGSKTIGEIGVFTVQDNFQNPADPTEAMTFAQYGNADFEVQYWDGASWVTVSGGIVTGNNRVWRRLTFSPVTTTKIRVVVTRGLFGHSQIAEVEAYET
jgi:peptidyl-Asp metalloendopeptidase